MTNMTNKPCLKIACKECAFKRTSAAGWLGAASFDDDPAMSFITPHWLQDMPLPCHTQVDWESSDSQQIAKTAPLCYGLLTMMKNSNKLPRVPAMAQAVRDMKVNHEDYFSNLQEFVNHHNRQGE